MGWLIRSIGRVMVALLAMAVVVGLLASGLLGIGAAPLAVGIALAHALMGVPLYFLIRRWREVRFRDAAFAGFVIGSAPSQLYVLVTSIEIFGWQEALNNALDPMALLGEAILIAVFGGCGTIAAVIFLMIVQGGPDQPVRVSASSRPAA